MLKAGNVVSHYWANILNQIFINLTNALGLMSLNSFVATAESFHPIRIGSVIPKAPHILN